MNKLLSVFNLIAGCMLVRFTVSKLAAWPISVAAFEDMAKPLGIDPTMFRIGTGFIIGLASISLFLNFILILKGVLKSGRYLRLFIITNLYIIGTMSGALFSEFFLRSEVKWMLVWIALGIISIAIINLLTRRKK